MFAYLTLLILLSNKYPTTPFKQQTLPMTSHHSFPLLHLSLPYGTALPHARFQLSAAAAAMRGTQTDAVSVSATAVRLTTTIPRQWDTFKAPHTYVSFLSPSSNQDRSFFATDLHTENSPSGGVRRRLAPCEAAPVQTGTLGKPLVESNNVLRVDIKTLGGCGLGIARYPDFVYNAKGGGGSGTVQNLKDGRFAVKFDVDKLYIPAVGFDTATFLGLPLPPFIRIEIIPQVLKGFIERDTGKVELEFLAKFLFSVSSLYRPPPILVDTILTTETAQGQLRSGQGCRLNSTGYCRLVGIAPLAQMDDAFMNAFLMLPTDCLADMAAQFTFS